MLVIRPIRRSDLDALVTFAHTTHASLTSLPRDRELLAAKIEHSLESFATSVKRPKREAYYFIMEDLQSGSAAGTCGILAKTGIEEPLYFWRLETIERYSPLLEQSWTDEVLKPVAYRHGPSEICQLYLFPDYRKGGLGRLLSLSRFLFMSCHPERFEPTIIAQMRGYLRQDGTSPFWDHVGRPFWDVSFEGALAATAASKACIPEIVPQYPVYTRLLHPDAKRNMQKPHRNTAPAMRMLQQEGFAVTADMDIFDAGPKISAPLNSIRVKQENRLVTVRELHSTAPESERLLLCNTRIDFRACYGGVVHVSESEVAISQHVARALEVELGEEIRYVHPIPTEHLETLGAKQTARRGA